MTGYCTPRMIPYLLVLGANFLRSVQGLSDLILRHTADRHIDAAYVLPDEAEDQHDDAADEKLQSDTGGVSCGDIRVHQLADDDDDARNKTDYRAEDADECSKTQRNR